MILWDVFMCIVGYLGILFLMNLDNVALDLRENKDLPGSFLCKLCYYVGMAAFSSICLMLGVFLIITGTALYDLMSLALCENIIRVVVWVPFVYAAYLGILDVKQYPDLKKCLLEAN